MVADDDYKAQLLAVEAKLAKDPDNEDLLMLKSDLIELIELSGAMEADEAAEEQQQQSTSSNYKSRRATHLHGAKSSSASYGGDDQTTHKNLVDSSKSKVTNDDDEDNTMSRRGANQKRQLSEAELLAKRREKNKKKKAKLREKVKEQLDTAESVKQSWQSFNNQKGLKGLTKKSIFASPCSSTGKVGVGTNGIADAAPAARMGGASSSSSCAPITQRRRY